MRTYLRLLVATAAFLAAFYYSSGTAIYECSGMGTKASNTSGPITLFIKVTQNRWWAFWDPADGRLRWEYTTGNFPTVTGDDPNAARWIRTGSGLYTAPPFAGMMYFANARKDFFVIKRAHTFLSLFRWPKAGETVDLTTKSTQGRFSTISNALTFNISEGAMFNGSCKPKNN